MTQSSRNSGWERILLTQLEARLREIVDAQDRLPDGTYGKCVECGEQIAAGRLMADPAAHLCLNCQKIVESDHHFCTL